MTLDRHAAERRRFARLLGVDGTLGSGLPTGTDSRRRPAECRSNGHQPKSHREEGDSRLETSRTDAESDRS